MEGWQEKYFKDFIKLNRGFDLPNSKLIAGRFPVVTSTEIKSFHINFKVKAPGVVTGRSGSLGVVQYVEDNYWPHNTSLYVKDFKGNYPKFVYYFLQMMHLENFNSGAGVPSLNQNHLHKQKIIVPDFSTQQRIASILSAYDDLIAVNNQRIKLLEETARELYKEWFVRMRFPGYKKSKFSKGIPKEWKNKPIGKCIDYEIGGGWGNDRPNNKFIVPGYVIRGTDIPEIRKGAANKEVYRFHKASNMESRELKEGDIIFETAGGSEGQPLGRTCFITQEILNAYGDKVMAASFCKLIRTESVPSLYLYYFINYLYDTGMIETYQVQSTGISNYQWEPFLKFQHIILPDDELIKLFHNKAMLIQRQIANLGIQNEHLRQIRDRLLPRLVSGKLRVKQIKQPQAIMV